MNRAHFFPYVKMYLRHNGRNRKPLKTPVEREEVIIKLRMQCVHTADIVLLAKRNTLLKNRSDSEPYVLVNQQTV